MEKQLSKDIGGAVISKSGNNPADATKGGFFNGRPHSAGGIKAINVSTNQPIEVEGGEVIITKPAVEDKTKRLFEGKMLTNREILSRINQDGGGVAIFEDGGETGHVCGCSGKKYNYGGNLVTDYDILTEMSQYNPEQSMKLRKARYKQVPRKVQTDNDRYLPELTDCEKKLFYKFKVNKEPFIKVGRDRMPLLDRLEEGGYIYATPLYGGLCMEVHLTDMGRGIIDSRDPSFFESGIEMDCGCDEQYKDGGATIAEIAAASPNVMIAGIPKNYQHFKGVDAEYKNQFEINKAIEELLEKVPANKLTIQEKAFLTYFSGYGGLEKYGATGKGLLYEYFTPSAVALRMWGLAYKHGYKGGTILEPSCGIGEFIKYAPGNHLVTAYEINEVSAKIAGILYPGAKIIKQAFETIFIKANTSVRGNISGLPKFSLVIGNPPYGTMGGIDAGMGEKSYTKSNNYIDYFIIRGLDLLESNGLLIYIIGTEVAAGGVPFLQQPVNAVKKAIAEKADLVDAYRLPNGIFERTDVLTDIVVFKKK